MNNNEVNVGSLVMIIVEHPDGSNTETYGDIGVVSKIENITGVCDYTVRTKNSAYLYGVEQIRLITDDECREALRNILMG